MKFKKVFFLSLLFLGFLVLFFCRSETEPPELQSAADIVALTTFSEELKTELSDEDMMEHSSNLAETTVRFRDRLIELFNPDSGDRNYKEMAVLLADRATIIEDTSEEFTRLYGAEEIAGLFKKLPEGDLEFEIRHIFIDKIFDPRTEDGEKVDMVARIFFRYRVPHVDEGTLKNNEGVGSSECLHRLNCPWCPPEQ
jgi:hypothetical protein